MAKSTVSVPPGERQSWIINEPVVGVRIRGTSNEYLLGERDVVTVGSDPSSIIYLASPDVSRHHCTIQKRSGRWIVCDEGSKNGIYDRDERRTMFELVPGAAFRIARVPLVAFSAAGKRARAEMQRYLGIADRFQVAVEGLLQVAGERRHVILQTPAGGAGVAIARAIHAASRRDWPFITVDKIGETPREQRALLDSAAYGTLVVRTDHLPVNREDLLDRLASWAYHVRLVAIAPRGTKLASALGERLLSESAIVPVPTVVERRGEMDALLSLLRADVRLEIGHMDADLRPEDAAFIGSHSWPENMEELERYVERVLAIRACRGLRPAAKALGISPAAMIGWAKRNGVQP